MIRDAQGQTYWQWCRAQDFAPQTALARWDAACLGLALASRPVAAPAGAAPAQTRAAAAAPPIAIDAYGGWARVVRAGAIDRVMAGGAADPETEIWRAPPGARIRDIAATARDWLVIALDDGAVVTRDLLDRFPETRLSSPGFSPDRIAEDADGAIWLLDRAAKTLRRLDGDPLPARARLRRRADHAFQPNPLDPGALRLIAPPMADLSAAPEEFIDIAGLPGGGTAILGLGAGRRSALRIADGQTLSDAIVPEGLLSAFSIRADGPGHLAALVPGAAKAVRIAWADGAAAMTGAHLPLRRWDGGRLCATLPGAPPSYPATGAARPFARLVAASRPSFAPEARINAAGAEADQPGAVWHRIYLEGDIPADCGITLLIGADDDPAALAAAPPGALHPHRFGAAPGPGPLAVWLDQDSERPWLGAAKPGPRKPGRRGLFSALVQKTGAPVKRIAGRHLRVDVILHGSGLATPRLHALRIWGPRRSLRDSFLPDHLGIETGPMAEGADFLDRQLALFESVLTPLEDEAAASWRLTRPDAAPADALDWLAGWIGADLDAALPVAARRRLLAEAVPLWRRRGTLPGLERMLDIVTMGGVARGDLVVLEHFHLRRTFATILGADLSDDTNPLTPWAGESGNSHLGATFFLGDADQKAFFALFRPELLNDPLTDAEERAAALEDLADFFDDHAFRVTILLNKRMDKPARDLIARVLAREVPAHVIATMADGPGSLVLALSSLLGVETRFGPAPPKAPLTVDAGAIGQVWLTDVPSLDPRFEGGA